MIIYYFLDQMLSMAMIRNCFDIFVKTLVISMCFCLIVLILKNSNSSVNSNDAVL